MEPNVSAPQFGPEKKSTPRKQDLEQIPIASRPEVSIEVDNDHHETVGELAGATATQAHTILPAPIAPTPLQQQANGDSVAVSDDDTPTVAADSDLIEKEWVDKAKKIVADTKDNPHKREEEVGRLQRDYLKKRYGKEIGATN